MIDEIRSQGIFSVEVFFDTWSPRQHISSITLIVVKEFSAEGFLLALGLLDPHTEPTENCANGNNGAKETLIS